MNAADDERIADRTAPPSKLIYLDPDGPLWAAQVFLLGHLVGAIWVAESGRSIPRAGIVNVPDPSLEFQRVFGEMTLRVRRDEAIDAVDWISSIASAAFAIGRPERYLTVDGVRRLTGLIA